MKGATCFSGIGAPECAMPWVDWQFSADVEPFPNAVRVVRHPALPNLGDVLADNFLQRASSFGHINLLVGGPPCQDFSVAGLRAGIYGDRGNLTLRWVQIIHAIRPDVTVTENVPGWLSANDGHAFGAFIAGLVGHDTDLLPPKDCGGRWTDAGMVDGPFGRAAWRILDAQYFGLAQRRKRVFVVFSFRGGICPAAVLFEPESLRGHPAPSRKAGERPAPTISSRPTGGGGLGTDFDCDGGLIARPLLSGGHSNNPLDENLIAHAIQAGALRENPLSGPDGVGVQANLAYTLEARAEVQAVAHSLRADGFDASEDGTGRGTPLVPVQPYTLAIRGRAGGHNIEYRQDGTANALLTPNGGRGGIGVGAVAFAQNQRDELRVMDIAGALASQPGMKQQTYVQTSGVRRLTPRECERLQGFPEIRKSVTIPICYSDRQKTAALAETQNLRLQTSAWNAGGSALMLSAESAAANSSISLLGQEWPVALHVLVDLELRAVRISSQGKLTSFVSGAEASSEFPLRLPIDAFVQLAAAMHTMLVPTTQCGQAALHLNTKHSMHQLNGSAFVPLFGSEISALASDAEKFTGGLSQFMKSITLEAGPNSQTSARILETWSCFVAAAISSCIPEPIRAASSYALSIETTGGYTLIPWRNGTASDGPRYKALGNSMAVPVMAWIGRRIAAQASVQRIAA